MKNLILIPILLPTDDASQIGSIVSNDDGLLAVVIPYEYGKNMTTEGAGTDNMQVHYLYLCSDLSIKEGNWHISYLGSGGLLPTVSKYDGKSHIGKDDIKIEFTTDPKLIAEGVLAIDENTKALVISDFSSRPDRTFDVNFLEEFCKRYNQKDKISERKTIEQCKDEVAIKHRFSKWIYLSAPIQLSLIDEICELYANQKDNYKVIDDVMISSLRKEIQNDGIPRTENEFCMEFAKRIQAFQSNAGSYSLEDMRKCYEGVKQNVGTSIKQSDLPTFDEYIQSLTKESQSKGDIVIECETMVIAKSNMSTRGVGGEFSGYQERIKLKDRKPILIFR